MRNLWYKITIISVWLFLPFQCFAQTTDPGSTVNNLVQAYMAQNDIPGAAVALYYHNQTYLYNFGVTDRSTQQPVTSNTIFEIGSITKVFTATLLAEQILNHKMNLSDPVVNYLPPQVKNANGAINQVTIQELATHTSGLPKVIPGMTLVQRSSFSSSDFMNYLAQWQPDEQIGSEYQYSNIGFGLLGYVLEGATGQTYAQLLQTQIFNPLGMTSTSLDSPVDANRYATGYNQNDQPARPWPQSAWPAGGALRSTATDMLNFLKANLGVQAQGVPPQLIQAMQLAQKPILNINNFSQGMAWSTAKGIVGKNGGTAGFGSAMNLMPSENMGIVILTNRAGSRPTILAKQILQQLA